MLVTLGWIMGCRLLLLCLFPQVAWTTTYKKGDTVMLYVNKVGPYHNPQETYHYYTLPVCRPKKVSVGPFFLLLLVLTPLHHCFNTLFINCAGAP